MSVRVRLATCWAVLAAALPLQAQSPFAGTRSLGIPPGHTHRRATLPLTLGRYGFRYDPLVFVAKSDSLDAAKVRRLVFGQSQPGDQARIDARLAALLKDQNRDGSFGRTNAECSETTFTRLDELVDLGIAVDHPQIRQVLDYIRNMPESEPGQKLRFYYTRALLRLGQSTFPGLKAALTYDAAHPETWVATGCPWTPAIALKLLWEGRAVVDTGPVVEAGLGWVADNLNAAGCLRYWDPWGLLDCAAEIDLPASQRIVQRQLPMILRGQRPDGGWGEHSVAVFRALSAYGYLDALRVLAPYPPDWAVTRNLPLGELDGFSLAWGNGRFWTIDGRAQEAVSLDHTSGAVLSRIKLPAGRSFALTWWDGSLAVVQQQPKRLLKLDSTKGTVLREFSLAKMGSPLGAVEDGARLRIGDGWTVGCWSVDPRRPRVLEQRDLAGPGPFMLCRGERGFWHLDFWAPALIGSDPDGGLLGWGEKPFGEATAGVAWDGDHLWALDGKNHRLCAIERVPDSD